MGSRSRAHARARAVHPSRNVGVSRTVRAPEVLIYHFGQGQLELFLAVAAIPPHFSVVNIDLDVIALLPHVASDVFPPKDVPRLEGPRRAAADESAAFGGEGHCVLCLERCLFGCCFFGHCFSVLLIAHAAEMATSRLGARVSFLLLCVLQSTEEHRGAQLGSAASYCPLTLLRRI